MHRVGRWVGKCESERERQPNLGYLRTNFLVKKSKRKASYMASISPTMIQRSSKSSCPSGLRPRMFLFCCLCVIACFCWWISSIRMFVVSMTLARDVWSSLSCPLSIVLLCVYKNLKWTSCLVRSFALVATLTLTNVIFCKQPGRPAV